MKTQDLIRELIARIEDQKFDPEPQYDALLSNMGIAEREILLNQLKMVYNAKSKV